MGHIKRRRLRTGKSAYLAVYRVEGRERSRQFARRIDAERFLATTEAAKAEGRWVDPAQGRVSLQEWADHAWDPITAHLGVKSKERADGVLRHHVLPRFGSVQIAGLEHLHVCEWVTALQEQGLSPSTVAKAYQTLDRLLEAAVRSKRLATNPADGVKLPPAADGEARILTDAELDRLIAAFDSRYRVWPLFAAYSGLRAGESFGLRRSRFDALRGRVTVAEECLETRGQIMFKQPKTNAGRRVVPIPRFVAAELVSTIPANAPDDHLVFQAPGGGPVRINNFRQRAWYPALSAAGLEGLRMHDLRHTAVSRWIDAGATPKQAQTWAGHRSIRTTYDVYGHLFPDREDRVMDVLEGARGTSGDATHTRQ
ncbi:MAG: tyrosine-type recombinase/integrase [Acidimicrobiia bacterium]